MKRELVLRREDLTRPYRRPLRYVAASAWRGSRQLRWRTGIVAASGAITVAGAVAGSAAVLALGAFGVFVAGFATLPWIVTIGSTTFSLRRAWRQKSDLARVRRKRPHAGLADPDVAHTMRAAEQLVEAQDRAARLEHAAIERALAAVDDDGARAELEIEVRSTAEALRRLTGQSRR